MFAKAATAAALAFLATSVVAQFNETVPTPEEILQIPADTKNTWCNSQFNSCNTLCANSASHNFCNTTTLDVDCICAANNSAPALQYYIQTIPTFLCEMIFDECTQATTQNATAQAECQTNEKKNCGQFVPVADAASPSSTTSSAASSTTGKATTTSSGGAAPTSSSSSSVTTSSSAAAAATMLALGREYGSGVIAAGFAAAMLL